MIECRDVCKSFGEKVALDHLSLSIPKGKIFGLLGPNGAGKTTLIRIINRITIPNGGTILFDGRPITQEDVRKIGYLPEERGLYRKMKVGDQAMYFARLKGMTVREAASELKAWFEKRYSCKIGAKGEVTKEDLSKLEGVSKKQLEKLQKLQNSLQEQKEVIEQLASGKILARISSRPGQSGRADGYILEDDELAFYHRKINQKKK